MRASAVSRALTEPAMFSRRLKDILAEKTMAACAAFAISILFLMGIGLYLRARPIFAVQSFQQIVSSSSWHPTQNEFGLAAFIAGTAWVTVIAMLIAVPLGIFTALYLSEYAPRRVRELSKPAVDLLSGISPVIYGVWGVIAIVPLVRDYLMPFFSERFQFFPFVSDNYTGFCALTAGIVLAVMVVPLIIAVVQEVLRTVPQSIREASLALGATKWQTIKGAVLKKARAGIIAAVLLSLSRAFGETIAVLMVAGCSLGGFPRSVFDTAYPLSSLVANTYGEMMSIPLYDAAILTAAFILLLVTAASNMIGWGILLRLEKDS